MSIVSALSFSSANLHKIAAAAGGVALLVGVAVLLTEGGFGFPASSLSAAVVCGDGACEATSPNLTLSIADGQLAVGGSSLLSWTGEDLLSGAGDSVICFGKDSGSPCGTTFQEFGDTLSYMEGGWSTFPVGSSIYLAAPNYDSANPTKIYKWMTTTFGKGSREWTSSAGSATTNIERTWQLDAGAVVTQVGSYNKTPQTITVKIVKRNSTGNYDVVVSESCAHPGIGWHDCTLSTPYTVPASGQYFVGAYTPSNDTYSYTPGARAYKAGNITGTGQIGFTEQDTSAGTAMRATYQSAVSGACAGDGTFCNSPVQSFLPGTNYVRGGFSHFNVGGEDYLAAAEVGNTSKIYKWMPTISGRQTPGVGAVWSNGYTYIEKGWRLDPGATVTSIGSYFTTAQTIYIKIAKYNSGGNYDIVVSEPCTHPGTGWYDCTLSVPYSVPQSGAYYVGAYGATGIFYYSVSGYSTSATKITHICAVAPCTGQSGFTEQTSYSPVMRATYQSAVTANCFGDGGKVCGNPFQIFATGASNVAGGFTPFEISNVQYLAAGSNGDTSKIYKWMSSPWMPTQYNGTLTNGPTQTTGTVGDSALSFDGTNDYVALPTAMSLNSSLGSVSVWIKTNKVFTDQGHIFYGSPVTTGDGSGSTQEMHVNFNATNQLQFFIEGGTTDVNFTSPLTYNDNAWHHVVATWDINGQAILYVDGAQVGAATHDAQNFSLSSLLQLGKPGAAIRYYTGALDDVRIYNRTLSSGEVSSLYNQQSVSNNLLARWTFDSSAVVGTVALESAGNAPGCFGSGSACGAALQTFATGATYQEGGWEYFQIGSDHYLAAANYYSDNSRIYKWQPAQECFGNGTTCGTALQNFTTDQTAYNYGGWEYFQIGSNHYLVSGSYYNPDRSPLLFVWMSGSNCFGNGTTCGTALQTLPSGYHLAGGFKHFMVGSDHYFAGGAYYNGPRTSLIYKWTPSGTGCPSGGGLGDGISCGTQLQLFPATAVGYSLGGWEHIQTGTDHYLLGANYADTSKIFKLNAVTCFGNSANCASLTLNSTFQTLSANDAENTMAFTAGASSYLAVANGAGATSPIYKWMSGPRCFGDGSACGTALQQVSTNAAKNWDAFTVGANTYLVVANMGSSPSRVYQWMPAGNGGNGCAGDGTTCGASLQNIVYVVKWVKSFSPLGTTDTFLSASIDGTSRLFKWNPSGSGGLGCFGDSAGTCGNTYQSLSASNPQNADTVNAGGNTYLLQGNYTSRSIIYKWTPSGAGCPSGGGMGNGTDCNNYLQTFGGFGGNANQSFGRYIDGFTVGNNAYAMIVKLGTDNEHGTLARWNSSTGLFDADNLTVGANYSYGVDAITIDDATYVSWGLSSGAGVGIYKWTTSGAGCPANGSIGDGVVCSTNNKFQQFSPSTPNTMDFFEIDNTAFVALAGGASDTVSLYKYSSGSLSACTLFKYDATNGTTTLASADSGTDINTGALSETTTYTLTCDMEGGGEESAALTVQVGEATTVIATDATASETAGNAGTYTLFRSSSSASALTVNYTLSGSAQNGTDYTSLSGSAIIPANQASVTVTLTPTDDQSYEGSETATLTIAAGAGYTLGSPATADVVISDNETISQVPTLTSGMLTITPNPVRRNNTVNISYNVTGLILENTCTISASPAAALSPSLSHPGGTTAWTGGPAASDPVTSQTIFTLRCLAPDGTTQSSTQRTVNLIPTVQEI